MIQSPEDFDDNFDLKSDYCIDYYNSPKDENSNSSDTWSSLKGILDEVKIKIEDYKELLIKSNRFRKSFSLNRSNRSKN